MIRRLGCFPQLSHAVDNAVFLSNVVPIASSVFAHSGMALLDDKIKRIERESPSSCCFFAGRFYAVCSIDNATAARVNYRSGVN